MKPSDYDKEILPVLKLVGGGLVLWGGYKLLQKVGIFKSTESRTLKKSLDLASERPAEVDPKNPFLAFSPKYFSILRSSWKKKYSGSSFSPTFQFSSLKVKGATSLKQKVDAVVERLDDAKGVFSDDEVKLYSIFKAINTQYQLSVIARHFKLQKEVDLLTYIKSFTNEKELLTLLEIVKKYPLYIKPS